MFKCTAYFAVTPAKYAVPNKVIPKLSPELSPKRCYHMQSVQYHLQNMQYPMQNMQYKTKLSPSYPQSYHQKGVTHCKMCSTQCKICSTICKIRSTTCKIRSTTCKICSTICKIRSIKQSYPQVIPRVIPNGSVTEK